MFTYLLLIYLYLSICLSIYSVSLSLYLCLSSLSLSVCLLVCLLVKFIWELSLSLSPSISHDLSDQSTQYLISLSWICCFFKYVTYIHAPSTGSTIPDIQCFYVCLSLCPDACSPSISIYVPTPLAFRFIICSQISLPIRQSIHVVSCLSAFPSITDLFNQPIHLSAKTIFQSICPNYLSTRPICLHTTCLSIYVISP